MEPRLRVGTLGESIGRLPFEIIEEAVIALLVDPTSTSTARNTAAMALATSGKAVAVRVLLQWATKLEGSGGAADAVGVFSNIRSMAAIREMRKIFSPEEFSDRAVRHGIAKLLERAFSLEVKHVTNDQ